MSRFIPKIKMSIGYFKDHIDQERWCGTYLEVNDNAKPFYQLLTGGENKRFILTTPKFRCHWGVFLRTDWAYYAGIYLIGNPIDIISDDMPITPITSAEIEHFKSKKPSNIAQYWANFYAEQLLTRKSSVLTKGYWKIEPAYSNNHQNMVFDHDDLLTIDSDQIYYHFEWDGFPFDSVLTLKSLPNDKHGRVKWWRKKIKERTCPPLLFWWQEHCQTLLLIDGHSRLKAHQLENVSPDYLVLSNYYYHYNSLDVNHPERIKGRLRVLRSLKKSLANGKRQISLEHINQIIVDLYNDKPCEKLTTIPKTLANLDDIFEQDLQALAKQLSINDEWINKLLTANQQDTHDPTTKN